MRFLIPAAAVAALLTFQAQAQTTDTTTPAPATNAPATTEAPATPAPSTQTAPKKKSAAHKQTLQQRFDAANSSHDGHLTKDQATAANWPYVVNNFAAIDKDNKGYVTVADIHAYSHARHAARQKPAAPAAATPNKS